jgi:hypothetical protein
MTPTQVSKPSLTHIGLTDTSDIAKTSYQGQPSAVRAKICRD